MALRDIISELQHKVQLGIASVKEKAIYEYYQLTRGGQSSHLRDSYPYSAILRKPWSPVGMQLWVKLRQAESDYHYALQQESRAATQRMPGFKTSEDHISIHPNKALDFFSKAGTVANLSREFTVFDIETDDQLRPISVSGLKMGWNAAVGKLEVKDTYRRFYNASDKDLLKFYSTHRLSSKELKRLRKKQGAAYGSTYDKEEALAFKNFIGDSILVGHNIVNFDIPQLFRPLKQVPENQIIDTLFASENIFGKAEQGVKNDLDTLVERLTGKTMNQLGLPHHMSDADVIATALAFQNMALLPGETGDAIRYVMTHAGTHLAPVDEMLNSRVIKGTFSDLYSTNVEAYMDEIKAPIGDIVETKGGTFKLPRDEEGNIEGYQLTNIDKVLQNSIQSAKDLASSTAEAMKHSEGLSQESTMAAQSLAEAVQRMALWRNIAFKEKLSRFDNPEDMRKYIKATGWNVNQEDDFIKAAEELRSVREAQKAKERAEREAATGLSQIEKARWMARREGDDTALRMLEGAEELSAEDRWNILQDLKEREAATGLSQIEKARWMARREGDDTALRMLEGAEELSAEDRWNILQDLKEREEEYKAYQKESEKAVSDIAKFQDEQAKLEVAKSRALETYSGTRFEGLIKNATDIEELETTIDDLEKASRRAAKAERERSKEIDAHNRLLKEYVSTEKKQVSPFNMFKAGVNSLKLLTGPVAETYSKLEGTLGHEWSGIKGAAHGVIPGFVLRPYSRFGDAMMNQVHKGGYLFRGIDDVLGSFSGVGGKSKASLALSSIGRFVKAGGSIANMKIGMMGEEIQSRLNLWGGIIDIVATPFKLLASAIKTVIKALGGLTLALNGLMINGIKSMGSLGVPLTNLTGVTFSRYQQSLNTDRFVGLGAGTSNNMYESMAFAQQGLYSLGQVDTTRLVSAAMLGQFSTIYSHGGDAQQNYTSAVNNIARQMRGASDSEKQRLMYLAHNIDPNMAKTLQVMNDMGITDYNEISGGGWLAKRGIRDYSTLASANQDRKNFRTTYTEFGGIMESMNFSKMRIADRLWQAFGKDLFSGLNDVLYMVSTGDWKGAFDKAVSAIKNVWSKLKEEVFGDKDVNIFHKLGEGLKSILGVSFKDLMLKLVDIIGQGAAAIINIWGKVINTVMEQFDGLISYLGTLRIDKSELLKWLKGDSTATPIVMLGHERNENIERETHSWFGAGMALRTDNILDPDDPTSRRITKSWSMPNMTISEVAKAIMTEGTGTIGITAGKIGSDVVRLVDTYDASEMTPEQLQARLAAIKLLGSEMRAEWGSNLSSGNAASIIKQMLIDKKDFHIPKGMEIQVGNERMSLEDFISGNFTPLTNILKILNDNIAAISEGMIANVTGDLKNKVEAAFTVDIQKDGKSIAKWDWNSGSGSADSYVKRLEDMYVNMTTRTLAEKGTARAGF